jgi:hypothetical protein
MLPARPTIAKTGQRGRDELSHPNPNPFKTGPYRQIEKHSTPNKIISKTDEALTRLTASLRQELSPTTCVHDLNTHVRVEQLNSVPIRIADGSHRDPSRSNEHYTRDRRDDGDSADERGWPFGIVRHELADAWERGRVEDRARRRLGLEPLALTDEVIERIEQLGDGRSMNALQLLEGLPDDQRSAVKGRVLEERGYTELAAALSCSDSVVRHRVSAG